MNYFTLQNLHKKETEVDVKVDTNRNSIAV
ncbi:Uncharacterised protein [BD1-7 clade bacterium]|uniref:Uncharacterized protein n=1 Tax=BD1-7 clade bacterium TaxID=2029982 RepID=A0A5S9MSA9_9GAMM|nr:Uncharacterised protein [BD1-7 clade bacterium]